MSKINLNLTETLFGAKETIAILSGSYATNKIGPAGIGFSKHRPASAKTAAKFNGAARVLDKLLIDKKINALENDTNEPYIAYSEFTDGGEYFQAFVTTEDGEDALAVSYESKSATGYAALVPMVMYAISNACEMEEVKELKECFHKIVEQVNSKGSADIQDVLKFCDSFYYGFTLHCPDIKVFENDLANETIKQGYEQKYFELMDALSEIEGKPMFKPLEGVALRETKKGKAKKKKAVSDAFADCMEGNRAIPYEWSEKQQHKIPSLDVLKEFIPTPYFYSMLNKLEHKLGRVNERLDAGKEGVEAIGKDYINTFIIGKPGTGKTTLGYALGAAAKMPVYTVPITKNTEEDAFQGMQKIVDGGFKFVSTDFLEAYTHGGIIILEEVNLADPSVIMGALGQAVEAPFILMQDGYKAVRRHPMCVIIGTMNIGTYGSKGVSQAFSSRFKQTYILDDPKAEDFISILEKQGYSNKRCKWVYDAYTKINQYLKSPEISREEICLNVTLRGCIGALECMDEGDTPQQAIQNTLIGKVAEVDLELADDINKNIVKCLPNLSE